MLLGFSNGNFPKPVIHQYLGDILSDQILSDSANQSTFDLFGDATPSTRAKTSNEDGEDEKKDEIKENERINEVDVTTAVGKRKSYSRAGKGKKPKK